MNELAPYVRILGRGPGRSRNLTETEAFEAMQIILKGECAREAVGGLLMLMRYRGEEPQEIAGFVRAVGHVARDHVGPGYRLLANVGGDAGQEVPHLHVHLFGGRQFYAMVPQ